MNSCICALEIRDLSKTFRRNFWLPPHVALERLILTVARGETFGLLGPNGAGKSTTFRLLTGLLVPSGGQAWVFGEPIGSLDARRIIGYLPDQPALYDYLTAEETLTLCAKLGAVPLRRVKSRVDELLQLVGLTDVRCLRLRSFSKGMLQRIGIAQALVHDPALLLLDEPMSGLDPIGRADMRQVLRRLKQQGVTIVMSSHLHQDVQALCDRVGVLVAGRLAGIRSVSDLLAIDSARAKGGMFSATERDTWDALLVESENQPHECQV